MSNLLAHYQHDWENISKRTLLRIIKCDVAYEIFQRDHTKWALDTVPNMLYLKVSL